MSHQYRDSVDSAVRPLSNVNYTAADQYEPKQGYGAGYGSGYSAGKNYPGTKKRSKAWLWILLAIVAVLVVAGAVLGGVFGSRASKKSNATTNNSSDNNGGSSSASKGSGSGAVNPTGTDANGNPLYPTSTGSAAIGGPTLLANASLSCGNDSYVASTSNPYAVRSDHPVLFAPAYKWACLPKLIAEDSYMASWNKTIFANATIYYNMPPTNYSIDGGLTGSGVLDPAREVQLKIKHYGYAWKMSNDTKWVTRAWEELQVASGNSTTQYFGVAGNNWNTGHFLDVGEFTAAFAIAYDWFYDAWTPTQKTAIMWSILELGLKYGLQVYTDPYGAAENFSWWSRNINGNWNCVCNKGLTLGALAILNDDPTGVAAQILTHTVTNAAQNCAFGPSTDGTWSETANYWYFGSYSHTEMALGLLTATGSTHNLLTANPGMQLSGLFHMYVTGNVGMFDYGDTGPNKYTATANGMMFYGSQFNIPMYTLFQRDRSDAAEPMSMLYYDPQVNGDWWDGLALDHHFENTTDGWVSMRSSWTNPNGLYVAMKAGALEGHQTHGDLDVGDFVLDAMGQRWAGELGSADYLGDGYFSSEAQTSERWYYYRKRTEGQNTLMLNNANQLVTAVPTTTFNSTGEVQNALSYTPANSSTAFFTADMESAYGTAAKRAIRTLSGRRQVLLQDEITVPTGQTVQWRIQTNATAVMSNNNQTVTLSLGGQTLVATILSPAGAAFYTQPAVREASDPTLPSNAVSQDQPNAPAEVLTIELDAGAQTIAVLFNPQWSDFSSKEFITPPLVAIDSWTLTSHDNHS